MFNFYKINGYIYNKISNKNLYNLGLQGPDFLYFYKPFKKNNNVRKNQA